MNRHSKGVKGRNSFSKAIILAVVFVIAIVLYNRISKNGLPRNIFSMLEQESIDPQSYVLLNEDEKDPVNRKIAGFWVFNSDSSEAGVLSFSDRIELKENGIMWRVSIHRLQLPSGKSDSVMCVSHAYVRPFGRYKDDSHRLVCEVRVIREAVISNGDTCFGPGNVDEVWNLAGDGTMFSLKNRSYSSYCDADLKVFFPPKAIDIIDIPFKSGGGASPKEQWESARKSGKSVTGGSGVFAFGECLAGIDELSLVREMLNRTLVSDSAITAQSAASDFYAPLCMSRLFYGQAYKALSFDATVKLSEPGKTEDIKIVFIQNETRNPHLAEILKAEISKWKFGRHDNSEIRFSYRSFAGNSALPAR